MCLQRTGAEGGGEKESKSDVQAGERLLDMEQIHEVTPGFFFFYFFFFFLGGIFVL